MNANGLDLRWLWEALSALGIGVLMGLEREHARVEQGPGAAADPHAKGARTFGLIALYGYGAALCGERFAGLPLLALGALAFLLGLLHLRRPQPAADGPQPYGEDITTEVAALGAGVLGMLAHIEVRAAVGLGLLFTVILIAKPWLRGLVPRLRRGELTGTLQLLVAVLIVLPVVPDRTLTLPGGLSGVLNPRTVVLFVVLIASVGYVGYVLVRLLGPRRGLGLTGAVGGLTSSTAVTVALGERVREAPELAPSAALGTVLACVAMGMRVLGVAFLLFAPLGWCLLAPVAALTLGYLGTAAVLAWRAPQDMEAAGTEPQHLALRNPFELLPALKFGALYVAVLLLSHVARRVLGAGGFYLASALAGLADVDPTLLTAARLSKSGAASISEGALAILLALGANTLVKLALAFTSGGRRYGLRVAAGHGAAVLLGGTALLWATLSR